MYLKSSKYIQVIPSHERHQAPQLERSGTGLSSKLSKVPQSLNFTKGKGTKITRRKVGASSWLMLIDLGKL
jgi:hypothetical protein